MQREPSLTFEGALRILGKHEHKTIERIDKLLGGVILAGGAVTGAVALGVTPLAPLAAFGVVWEWAEQKGLALELLKSAVDAVSHRLSSVRGYERRELIAAAHTTIVMAAFFEALRNEVGAELYQQLKITDRDKIGAADTMSWTAAGTVVSLLYKLEIPAPSATQGFEENVNYVTYWLTSYCNNLSRFITGLAAGKEARIAWIRVRADAVERYRSRYLELAVKVPEFAIWAQLGEHAATRVVVRETGIEVIAEVKGLGTALQELNADVIAGFNANRDALNRVEALLSAGRQGGGSGTANADRQMPDGFSGLRQVVSQANTGILHERILPADRERYPAGLEIPRVSDIYVNPRYRATVFSETARPADERWWKQIAARDDFDVFLARQVTSVEATQRPLLLLGHPGAGKSLLTKVLAARLPAAEYTVVRVPLRRVSADAEIHHQIEEALDLCTHQRIAWSELAEQSRGTVLVVLLDGLDELLQASEHDRSKYLEDVLDFQEREVMQRRPVVVVVTSRTVVAERVRIPDGTTIVKLDPFNDDDIADWLGRWQRVNVAGITSGAIGELTLGTLRRQPQLAEQPLLLLMLALYAADRKLPQLNEQMATAELYQRLLDGFAQREAEKDAGPGHRLSPHELERRARDHLDRLAVAALGMFNRGHQDIDEEELGRDLETLEPRLMERSRYAEAGKRIIGEFFFVHAPEARTTAGWPGRGGHSQRAYEFLHATFGEYLATRRVMDELADVAVKAFSGRRGPAEPDDGLLFALLSHQVLAVRRSMLDFAIQIFATQLDDRVRPQVIEMLEELIRTYRRRPGSDRYAAYRPVPPDQVRQLACYSANLITLRVLLGLEAESESAASGLSLAELLRVQGPPDMVLNEWRGTPLLWRAGLDTDGLRAMLSLVGVAGSPPTLYLKQLNLSGAPTELSLARIIGDEATEKRLRYGMAIHDGEIITYGDSTWTDTMSMWLIPAIAGIGGVPKSLSPPPEGTPDEDIVKVAGLIFAYLRSTSYNPPRYKRILQLLFQLPPVFELDERALTAVAINSPDLREVVPELQNFEIYGHYAEVVRRADPASESHINNWQNPLPHVVRAVEDVLLKPLSLRKDD